MTPEGGPEPKFWQIPLADLEQRLGADRNGLSSAEVAARRLPLQTSKYPPAKPGALEFGAAQSGP
jgi:hypothetical protein